MAIVDTTSVSEILQSKEKAEFVKQADAIIEKLDAAITAFELALECEVEIVKLKVQQILSDSFDTEKAETDLDEIMEDAKSKAAHLRANARLTEATSEEKKVDAAADGKDVLDGRRMEMQLQMARESKGHAIEKMVCISEALRAGNGAKAASCVDELRVATEASETGAQLEERCQEAWVLVSKLRDAGQEQAAEGMECVAGILQDSTQEFLNAEVIAKRREAKQNLDDAMHLGKDVVGKLKGTDQAKKVESVLARLEHAMKGKWTLGLNVTGDKAHFNANQFEPALAENLHIKAARLHHTHVESPQKISDRMAEQSMSISPERALPSDDER